MILDVKNKIIEGFNLSKCSEEEQEKIVSDLVRILVEKTFIDVLKEMDENELENLKKVNEIDYSNLPEIAKNHKNSLDKFFVIFNDNLNYAISSFGRR